VRRPAAYRFNAKEAYIRRDNATGDVILSTKRHTWDGFFAALKGAAVPADFLDKRERRQAARKRDPFAG
jgi:antitoxin VapB